MLRNINNLTRRFIVPSVGRSGMTSPVMRVGRVLDMRVFSSEKKAFDQGILEQSLIHDVTDQQSSTVKYVVPWFLKSMPPSYFNQIREELQRSHIKAIAAIHDLGVKSDLSLKIETKRGSSTEITVISTKTSTDSLLNQLNTLPTFATSHMSEVAIYSSKDGELGVNVFTFSPNDAIMSCSPDKAQHIFNFVEEVKAGKHVANSNIPAFSPLFERDALSQYISHCSPGYINTTSPRRFMIQRELYEKVRGTEGSAVHFENYQGTGGPANAGWVSIAAGNVLPDVLLRTTARMLKAHGIDIWRVHLDQVHDPLLTIPKDGDVPAQTGYVSLLRILVTPNPGKVDATHPKFGPQFINALTRDIKRSKWLDDSVMELGLEKCPKIGVDHAEVITTLASMLHGPLNKMLPGVFPSVKAITNEVTTNDYLATQTKQVAQLFIDKFNPNLNATEREAMNRDIEERTNKYRSAFLKVQREGARVALLKMLDAVNMTLRTNMYFEDRYALSLRVDPRLMLTDAELMLANRYHMAFSSLMSYFQRFP